MTHNGMNNNTNAFEHANVRSRGTNPQKLEVINTKRNPYLVDYEQYIRKSYRAVSSTQRGSGKINGTRQERRNRQLARQRARRRQQLQLLLCLAGGIILAFLIGKVLFDREPEIDGRKVPEWLISSNTGGEVNAPNVQGLTAIDYGKHPTWTENFLTVNEYSRPGDALNKVNSIFVHYTANQGTSAAQNRSYFEQLKDTHERSASAHFIIGYEGEIIQCVPLDEIAYAVQTRNEDSISIECCYLAEDGSFTQETYDSLIKLLQWLVEVYDLDAEEDILRHYDCGGKKCPIYYTEHEDAWEELKEDVKTL